VIICICRGKSDRDVNRAIANGASSVRDLQRCGMGDQCGSCVKSLRSMIAEASLTLSATMPSAAMAAACPTCGTATVSASAMA
jgi:bacterioferritin-associated ferredoxin